MRDLDRMIDEALGQEESELLRRIGGEPNLVERALGMFGACSEGDDAEQRVDRAHAFLRDRAESVGPRWRHASRWRRESTANCR